jgi:ribonucleoside-triphosphate reductase
MVTVIKRNGTKVPFEKEKIAAAINKAFIEVDGTLYENDTAADIAADIEKRLAANTEISIEQIQDLVEEYLMRSDRLDVAKAYIKYRYKRQVARQASDTFMKAIGDKLKGLNIENQNANVDEHSFGGRKGEADSILMKKYALDNIVSPKARKNHEDNRIYIHDLADYAVGSHNCTSIPFDHLLANGFNTRQTDIRPANSISTAFQLLAVIFQLQSLQQFGGVSATHLDWTMVPYVRKSFYKHFSDGIFYCQDDIMFDSLGNQEEFRSDATNMRKQWVKQELSISAPIFLSNTKAYEYAKDMTTRELQQAVEGMYHNLNTLQSRSGNQLPFTSINYGTCTLPEGRMVIKTLLEGSLNGVGKHHKTPIFPCGIFQIGEGINKHPGDPNYDLFQLALKSTAKRLYPNYANIDWSGNAGYDPERPDTYFSTINETVA